MFWRCCCGCCCGKKKNGKTEVKTNGDTAKPKEEESKKPVNTFHVVPTLVPDGDDTEDFKEVMASPRAPPSATRPPSIAATHVGPIATRKGQTFVRRNSADMERPNRFIPIGKRPGIHIARHTGELTKEWLTQAYKIRGYLPDTGQVTKVNVKTLGEGLGVMGDLALVDVELEGARPNAPTGFVAKFSPLKSSTPTFLLKNVFGAEAHWYNDMLEDLGLSKATEFDEFVPSCGPLLVLQPTIYVRERAPQ